MHVLYAMLGILSGIVQLWYLLEHMLNPKDLSYVVPKRPQFLPEHTMSTVQKLAYGVDVALWRDCIEFNCKLLYTQLSKHYIRMYKTFKNGKSMQD